ncbi:MAG: hypothetical protein REH79_02765 [Spiroplasma sp.]|nr:hypothetical protein [Spiroplasma sp.]
MKKLLVSLTGLVSISVGSTTPILNQIQTKVNINQQLFEPKEWPIENRTISKECSNIEDWRYFAIDNINLSSLGIHSIGDLDQYNAIGVPGIEIKFSNNAGDHHVGLSSDLWNAKYRTITSEQWSRIFWKQVKYGFYIALERATTMWYSESGDLMLRLAYHALSYTAFGSGRGNVFFPGTITFTSGSVVSFY